MKEKKLFTVKNMAIMSVLSALAAVLMLFEFPLPFIAPPFYGVDFSEIPVLIGGFALGPIAGVIIEALKLVIKLLLKPTSTAFVGELGNFLVGLCMILPATIIYRKMHSKKGAIVGLAAGTLCMAIGGAIVNYFFLLPAFSVLMNIPISAFVEMGTEIFPFVNSTFTFVLFCTAPFNLIKGTLVSVIVALIYKQMSDIIKKI